MKFDVTINTDDNYIQHSMAMLCSLYENNNEHTIVVHVLQEGLSDRSKQYLIELTQRYNNQILFYEVDSSPLQGVQFRKNRPLSMAAYYRLLLSSILPESISKVLYLDCDIIVLRDLSEIFTLEIDDYALAASLDQFPYDNQHRLQLHMQADERTFCSGVMLINLQYWRDKNVEPGLLAYAKRHRDVVYLHDQDVLNYYFKKKWFLLPPKWNRVAYSLLPIKYPFYSSFDAYDYMNHPMLYHYAAVGMKPWYDVNSPCRHEYLKYLRLSNFNPPKFVHVSFSKRLNLWKVLVVYNVKKLVYKFFKSYKTFGY